MECIICAHPLKGEIDTLIQSVEPDDLLDEEKAHSLLGQINGMIEHVYGPEARQVDVRALRVHAMKHPLITTDGEITFVENQQVIRIGEKLLPVPSLRHATIIGMALGLENIRLNPENIKPHHTIKLMQLAARQGWTLGQEELEEVLRGKLSAPAKSDGPMAPPADA